MMNNHVLPKGFHAGSCYIGFLPGNKKMLFPTEEEYIEYLQEYYGEELAS